MSGIYYNRDRFEQKGSWRKEGNVSYTKNKLKNCEAEIHKNSLLDLNEMNDGKIEKN